MKAATLREYLERPRVSWGLVKGDLPASDTWHLLIGPLVMGINTPNICPSQVARGRPRGACDTCQPMKGEQ